MTKFILVDAHILFRECLKLMIENDGIGEVIGEAGNGLEFTELLLTQHPDVVIMDLRIHELLDLETLNNTIDKQPMMQLLITALKNEISDISKLKHNAVKGLMYKSSGRDQMEKIIKTISIGQTYFANEFSA